MIGGVGKIGGIGAAGTGNASLVGSSNFYFNGTDQYATVLTNQTSAAWFVKTTFIMPALGKLNYIADSAGDSAIYVDASGNIKIDYTSSASALTTYNAGTVSAGSVVTLEMLEFSGILFVVTNNGSAGYGAAAHAAQEPYTRFGVKSGSGSSYFTGYILSFLKGQYVPGGSILTYQNSYSFNEGSGTTFHDTVGSADATIVNLGSAGGGWDY